MPDVPLAETKKKNPRCDIQLCLTEHFLSYLNRMVFLQINQVGIVPQQSAVLEHQATVFTLATMSSDSVLQLICIYNCNED
jgi:hypothetical protein